MAEILHQLIGSLSHYLRGFTHPRWCRISAINSSIPVHVAIANFSMHGSFFKPTETTRLTRLTRRHCGELQWDQKKRRDGPMVAIRLEAHVKTVAVFTGCLPPNEATKEFKLFCVLLGEMNQAQNGSTRYFVGFFYHFNNDFETSKWCSIDVSFNVVSQKLTTHFPWPSHTSLDEHTWEFVFCS